MKVKILFEESEDKDGVDSSVLIEQEASDLQELAYVITRAAQAAGWLYVEGTTFHLTDGDKISNVW